jgi:hypothetical protein
MATQDINPTATAIAAPTSRRQSERTEAPRQRDSNFGGPRLKLSVAGRIDGFHLYWENDDDGAIEQLLTEGFSFADPKEVKMQSHIVADADVASRVSRFVGKKADGSPLRAFLLKCPDEVWSDREAHRLEQADAWDTAIKAGKIQPDQNRYVPNGRGPSLDTQFRKEY